MYAYRYTYRPDGKLLEKSRNGTRVLSCSYYPEGTLKSLTDCRGKTLLYTYDEEGRLESLQTETGRVLARYTYTGAGRMATIESENGMVTRYRYDGEGNTAGLSIRKGEEGLLYDASFTYDLRGNRLTRTGWRLGGDGREETVSAAYAYDAMNRLIREERAGGGERYTYDKNGNRLSRTLFHYAGTKEAGNREAAVDLEEHYCYNKGNQLLERKSKEGTIRYTYDGNGNLIREVAQKAGIPGGGKEEAGQTRRYHYDGLNRQVKVGLPDGRSRKIRYDGEGLRAGLTTSEGESYTFLYHEGELICEEKGGQFSRRYIRGTHLAALETEGHQYHSCHLDEQGSTIYLTDRGTEVNNRYTYDAFGNLLNKQEGIENRILYTGQQYDRETEQYYLWARYYNPVIGRFTQEDTFRGDGLNLYAYCANNPVRYFDPSGHAAEANGCPNGSGEAEVTQQEAAKVDSKSGSSSWNGENEFYSVIREVELPSDMYPEVSDARHFQEANRQLHEYFQANPDFAQELEKLYPGIIDGVKPGSRGAFPRTAPTRALSWHHHPARVGVLQLIPREQHRAKGLIQSILHPNGKGGMENWGG